MYLPALGSSNNATRPHYLLQLALAVLLGLPSDGHGQATSQPHTNNWAVIVSTSRYWFNYRHAANALGVYRTVKRLGLPDSRILLLLADDWACAARNPRPGALFADPDQAADLYAGPVQVDYRGAAVTADAFLRLLSGRHDAAVPRSQRLMSDAGSNILVYLTGHGGNDFMKFQDREEVTGQDLADAVTGMWAARRYRQLLLVADTCKAASLGARLASPNLLALASSKLGENSYSYHVDRQLGLSVVDRFTFYLLRFLERLPPNSTATLADLVDYLQQQPLWSTLVLRSDLFPLPPSATRLFDFFGSAPGAAQHAGIALGGSATEASWGEAGTGARAQSGAAAAEPAGGGAWPASGEAEDQGWLAALLLDGTPGQPKASMLSPQAPGEPLTDGPVVLGAVALVAISILLMLWPLLAAWVNSRPMPVRVTSMISRPGCITSKH